MIRIVSQRTVCRNVIYTFEYIGFSASVRSRDPVLDRMQIDAAVAKIPEISHGDSVEYHCEGHSPSLQCGTRLARRSPGGIIRTAVSA
jgi:hypothetical protein